MMIVNLYCFIMCIYLSYEYNDHKYIALTSAERIAVVESTLLQPAAINPLIILGYDVTSQFKSPLSVI